MNFGKTKIMTMLGSKPVHRTYHQRNTKEGKTCQAKQQTIATCKYCEEKMQKKLLTQHHLSKECRDIQTKLPNNQQEVRMYWTPTTPTLLVNPQTVTLSMDNDTNIPCPHEDCLYYTNKRDHMRRHYRASHTNKTITIAKERLLPQCNNCRIFQCNAQTKQHMDSNECKQYTEIKRKRTQELIQSAATHVNFHIANQAVTLTQQLKCLEQIITDKDNNFSVVECQISKSNTGKNRQSDKNNDRHKPKSVS
jgi:hypothetical protein